MKKKIILTMGIAIIAVILIIFLIIFILNKKTIIDIKMQDNGDQKSFYELKVKKNGEYKLITKTKLSDDSEETTDITYNDKLTDIELEKVNTIVNRIHSSNGKFKYDYNKDQEYDTNTLGILENMVIAIENISMGEIEMGEMTRRAYGNTMLDNIISTQLQ